MVEELSQTSHFIAALAKGAELLRLGSGWPDNVDAMLAELGQATGVSRVWILQNMENSEDALVQDYVAEWATDPRFSLLGTGTHTSYVSAENPELWALMEQYKRGEYQTIIVDELCSGSLRSCLEKRGSKSLLAIPILVDDQWWGILGFDHCEVTYRWPSDEIGLLRTASCMLSNAILRSTLHAKLRQFDILQRVTDSLTWEYDLKRKRLWLGSHPVHPGYVRGEPRQSSLGLLLRMLYPADRRPFLTSFRQYVAEHQETFRHDVRTRRGNDWIWTELIGTLEYDEYGLPARIAGIALDIRRRKREEIHLARQARLDPLTGISNRGTFDRLLEHHLLHSGERGEDISLLLMDFDKFKQINDKWGHSVGDMVLKKFVNICSDCLRANDVFARIGGEEFGVILPGANSRDAVQVGERIRLAVEELKLFSGDEHISFTVSIGCVTKVKSQVTPEAIFCDADKALYRAKRSGRNKLVKG